MKYKEQLTVTLEEDEFSQKQRLAYKLEQVEKVMQAESNLWCGPTQAMPTSLPFFTIID